MVMIVGGEVIITGNVIEIVDKCRKGACQK